MKTYWDYTRKERSELAQASVDALLDLELMSKGVLKVMEPVMVEVPTVELKPIGKAFLVGDLAFMTADLAEKAIAEGARKLDYEYDSGYLHYFSDTTPEIKVTLIYSKQDLDASKKSMEKKKGAERTNAEARELYVKQSKSMNDILGGVWEDWAECREEGQKHAQVRATFEKYKVMADGAEGMALRFLERAFTPEEVTKAWAWSGEEMDLEALRMPQAQAQRTPDAQEEQALDGLFAERNNVPTDEEREAEAQAQKV